MAGCGGHRHGSVCIRGSERCSCFGIGCLLVLGGRSGSRGVRWMSAEGWPSRYGRCGRDDESRDVPLAVFWMRDWRSWRKSAQVRVAWSTCWYWSARLE